MRKGGLEPPRPCGHQLLRLARLPLRHFRVTDSLLKVGVEEGDDAAAGVLRGLHGCEQGRVVDRVAGHEAHDQPPASGGRMAISSPSATGSSGDAWARFRAHSGLGGS